MGTEGRLRQVARQKWERPIMIRAKPAARKTAPSPLVVRPGRFPFGETTPAHWIADKPELAQMINGASLVMPFLEPFLISSIQAARGHIADAALDADAAGFCGQELQHLRTHRRFNATLTAKGYERIAGLEARMRADYAQLQTRPLAERLAYTAGFEAMTMGVTKWVVSQRGMLFAKADPAMASFILWHMVEETEHKCVAFDVYQATTPCHALRAWGVLAGSLHVIRLTREGYAILLEHDGLWRRPLSRLKVWGHALRFLWHTIPFLFRAMLPGHDPRNETDPDWVREWIAGYDALIARSGEPAVMPMIDPAAPGIPTPFAALQAA
jgi:predicted metal-dependent hydrolase